MNGRASRFQTSGSRNRGARCPLCGHFLGIRSTRRDGLCTFSAAKTCGLPQASSWPQLARLASRHSLPGLLDGSATAVTSADRVRDDGLAPVAPESEGWAPVRVTKRRIQSRTVVAGSDNSPLIDLKLRPMAAAVRAAPMTSTRSSRRSSTQSGRITWVCWHTTHLPRCGRSLWLWPRSRTQRALAYPQSRSRPRHGQRSLPEAMAAATRAGGPFVMIRRRPPRPEGEPRHPFDGFQPIFLCNELHNRTQSADIQEATLKARGGER
jgi:hypothetical protein